MGRSRRCQCLGFITVDEERGIAYVPVGTPATDFYGGDRLGRIIWIVTFLHWTGATGKLKWFFQRRITIPGTTT